VQRGLLCRLPGEVLAEVALQARAPAGVAGVEEEVLQVHRDEFARVAQLVEVGAARRLAVVLFARAALADPHRDWDLRHLVEQA